MLSRRAFVLLPAAFGFAQVGCISPTVRIPRSIRHALAGMPAPDFEAPSATSSQVVVVPGSPETTLVTVVDFWASWCEACVEAMPALERLYRKNRERGVDVVGVSVDEEPRDAIGTVMAYGTTFPIVLDPHSRLQNAYWVSKIPTTFVIDRSGLVRWVGRNSEEMEQAVDKLVAIQR